MKTEEMTVTFVTIFQFNEIFEQYAFVYENKAKDFFRSVLLTNEFEKDKKVIEECLEAKKWENATWCVVWGYGTLSK